MMSVKEAALMSGFESRTYEYEAWSRCSLKSWSVIVEYVHETVLVYRLDIFAHKYTSDRHNLTKIMWTETVCSQGKASLSGTIFRAKGKRNSRHLSQCRYCIHFIEDGNIL